MSPFEANLDLKKTLSMTSKLSETWKPPQKSQESSRRMSMSSLFEIEGVFKKSKPKIVDNFGNNLEMQSWLRRKVEESGPLELKQVANRVT